MILVVIVVALLYLILQFYLYQKMVVTSLKDQLHKITSLK